MALCSCVRCGLCLPTSPAPPLPLVFWGTLGQVLLPLGFHQLVQLHGGLGVLYGGVSASPHLNAARRQEHEAPRDYLFPSRLALPAPDTLLLRSLPAKLGLWWDLVLCSCSPRSFPWTVQATLFCTLQTQRSRSLTGLPSLAPSPLPQPLPTRRAPALLPVHMCRLHKRPGRPLCRLSDHHNVLTSFPS